LLVVVYIPPVIFTLPLPIVSYAAKAGISYKFKLFILFPKPTISSAISPCSKLVDVSPNPMRVYELPMDGEVSCER
jgi:hypothetical protein